jgi:preprotein translocase subunit SecF
MLYKEQSTRKKLPEKESVTPEESSTTNENSMTSVAIFMSCIFVVLFWLYRKK